MARTCGPTMWVEFDRDDRDWVEWHSSGLTEDATAVAELENSGTWLALTVDSATGTISGYFAGPNFPIPAPAHVIPTTSHVTLRITDGGIRRDIDGGFIRLVP